MKPHVKQCTFSPGSSHAWQARCWTAPPTTLHRLFAPVQAVPRCLDQCDIPFEMQTQRLRVTHERQGEYPVYLLHADQLPFELTVFPRNALRQAPLGAIDE